MEQAHSAINSTYANVLPEASSDHMFLNSACARGHHQQPTVALDRRVVSRTQDVDSSQQVQAAHAISAVMITTERSNLVAEVPVNTPIVDHRSASDEQLLAAARSSDGEAFVELTARCVDSVRRRVFKILQNREDTEDVVQDTLVKAFTHLGDFRGTSAFSTWLTRIAINSALMLLRKRRSRSEVAFDQPGDGDQTRGDWEFPDLSPNAEQAYARRQAAHSLSRAVKRLPSRLRCVVEQYYGRERSMQEAADSLGITLAAAKSRLLRARLTIRSTLDKSAAPWRRGVTKKRGACNNLQQTAPEFRSRFVSTASG